MMKPSRVQLWLVAAGLPVAVAAGLIPAARPAAATLAVLAAAAILADAVLSRRLLDSVRASAPTLLRLYQEREAILPLEVVPGRAAGTLRIGLAWPAAFRSASEEQYVTVPPGGLRIEWPLTPLRRGEFALDAVYVERASRLRLWDLRRALPLGVSIHVLPSLRGRGDLLAFRRELAGIQTFRKVGKGWEFEKLREYLPGDGYDEIHWKASARRSRPITKVFQVERTREIYVAVDGSRLTGRAAAAGTRLDRYVSAALVLSAAAERNGDLFGLITFQEGLADFVRAGRGGAHGSACRRALSRLNDRPSSPDFNELAAQISVRLRGRALLLFLTDLDDPSTAEDFTAAATFLSRRHVVAVASIRPAPLRPLFSTAPDTVAQVYEQLSGHLGWRSLKELEARLRRQGVRFGIYEEEAFSRQAASLYHETKMRQLL